MTDSYIGSMRHRTAEMVTDGHPDKFCDQVADAILDHALADDPGSRVAIECLAKDQFIFISGEMTTKTSFDTKVIGGIEGIARRVWHTIGYGDGDALTVINHVKKQSGDIAAGVDRDGAGDQGIMVGFATAETPEYLPLEYVLARALAWKLKEVRLSRQIPWLRADAKTQVTLKDNVVTSVVVATQHDNTVSKPDRSSITDDAKEALWATVIEPVLREYLPSVRPRAVINGTGIFEIGGPQGDAGVVGRKIVADAYGPRVPVGGGAYSGKDPTKVDRSAAYMARHIAKAIVHERVGDATEAWVSLAFAIGQIQPEMVAAVTNTGRDVSDWVSTRFPDLSPRGIIEYLSLRHPIGWNYFDTAAFGHYGREAFPWERIATIR